MQHSSGSRKEAGLAAAAAGCFAVVAIIDGALAATGHGRYYAFKGIGFAAVAFLWIAVAFRRTARRER